MIGIQIYDQISLIAFWLVFIRVSAIILQFPLFDYFRLPGQIKVLSTLVISYALYYPVKKYVVADISHWGTDNLIALSLYYTLVGVVIGFFIKSILGFANAAGSIMSQQMGFGAMRYFDPSSNQQVGPVEKLIGICLVLLLISTGALIPMFKGVVISFEHFNTFQAQKLLVGHEYYSKFFKRIFQISILLASPLIFSNLLLYLVLGIVARLVPQMNVLMVSFVLNIGVGLFVFWIISQEMFQSAYNQYVHSLGVWFKYIGA